MLIIKLFWRRSKGTFLALCQHTTSEPVNRYKAEENPCVQELPFQELFSRGNQKENILVSHSSIKQMGVLQLTKFMTARCRTVPAKRKSAKARSEAMPWKSVLFCGLTCILRQTSRMKVPTWEMQPEGKSWRGRSPWGDHHQTAVPRSAGCAGGLHPATSDTEEWKFSSFPRTARWPTLPRPTWLQGRYSGLHSPNS